MIRQELLAGPVISTLVLFPQDPKKRAHSRKGDVSLCINELVYKEISEGSSRALKGIELERVNLANDMGGNLKVAKASGVLGQGHSLATMRFDPLTLKGWDLGPEIKAVRSVQGTAF